MDLRIIACRASAAGVMQLSHGCAAAPHDAPRRRHLLRRSAAVRGRALVHTYYILCTSGFVVYVVGTSSWSGAAEFRINVKFRISVEHLF